MRLRSAHDYSLDSEPITPEAMAAMRKGARAVAALLMGQTGMRQWIEGRGAGDRDRERKYKDALADLADAILYGKTRTNWKTVQDASGSWLQAPDRRLANKLKLIPRHLEVAGRMSPDDLLGSPVGQTILAEMGRTLKRQNGGEAISHRALISFLQAVDDAKKHALKAGETSGWPGPPRVSGEAVPTVLRLSSTDSHANAHRVSSGGARTRYRSHNPRGRSGRKRAVRKSRRVRRRRRTVKRRR